MAPGVCQSANLGIQIRVYVITIGQQFTDGHGKGILLPFQFNSGVNLTGSGRCSGGTIEVLLRTVFRTEINDTLGGKQIVRKIDYMQPSGLPPADVLQFDLDDGSMLLIRPAGTEPKMKIYSFESDDFKDVEEEIGKVIDYFRGLQS